MVNPSICQSQVCYVRTTHFRPLKKPLMTKILLMLMIIIDWAKVTSYSDVDIAWINWGDLFTETCDIHAPVKEKRV